MFEIHGTSILISRGDTGLLTLCAQDAALTDGDRVIFTVRRQNGGMVMRKIAIPDEEGRVQFPLLNSETENMREGDYEWDVRYVLGAKFGTDGEVTDGDEVITPFPPARLTVVKVVGKI